MFLLELFSTFSTIGQVRRFSTRARAGAERFASARERAHDVEGERIVAEEWWVNT